MFDVKIENGYVVDGTGNPRFRANIGIKDGKIARVSRFSIGNAEAVIDARGLVVSPGFMDTHTHSDLPLMVNPRAESKVRQGVTIEATGMDGGSLAPLSVATREIMKQNSISIIGGPAEITWDWLTFGEYLNRLEHHNVALNIAPLVGHRTVRTAVMGFEQREPSREELKKMKGLVADAMEQGAFGMTSELATSVGEYVRAEEIIELCRVVAKYGGIYMSHMRSEGNSLIKGVEEIIRVAEEAGVRAKICHHKAMGKANWGKLRNALRIENEARARGVDINCDQYPYTAQSAPFTALLPVWALGGGPEKMLERLRDPEVRKKIKDDMAIGLSGWENISKTTGWENIVVAQCVLEDDKDLEGMTMTEIARLRGVDVYDFCLDLILKEQGQVAYIIHSMWEDDVRSLMADPATMVCSDGCSLAPYGVLGGGKRHPRNYGTFPRILGKYVREEKVLKLEDAIRKMTSLPALKLGLYDRGFLREGMWADIVVFDADKVIDTATFNDPYQYPKGIDYVLVNGQVVIQNGKHTGRLPGKVLRHKEK
jgi:N-acyl-D-amino-acid deacylase